MRSKASSWRFNAHIIWFMIDYTWNIFYALKMLFKQGFQLYDIRHPDMLHQTTNYPYMDRQQRRMTRWINKIHEHKTNLNELKMWTVEVHMQERPKLCFKNAL